MPIDAPARPVLRTVPDVELAKVGTWPASTGEIDITPEHLAAAVQSAQSSSLARPVVKLGHVDPRFDGEPAFGFVDNLRLADGGSTLVGDLVGLPAWLADILPSAYPNRSIEASLNYRDQTGKVHPFALTGLALLGVTPPAIGSLASLRDVAALYDVAAARSDTTREEVHIMPEIKIAAAATVEDVRRSFYESGPGKDTYMWIEEMFLDPTEVIAMDDESGALKKIPFAVGDDDTVEWQEPQDVKREYVVASSRMPAARFASAAESRINAAESTTPTEEENPMELTTEQVAALIAALDLDDDADAAAIIKAVEKLAKDAAQADEEDDAPATDTKSVAAAAAGLGLATIPEAEWNQTKKQLSELQHKDRVRTVDAAIHAGKLMPSSRDAALKQLESGLLSAAQLEKMPPLVSMSGQEVGRGDEEQETNDPEDVRASEAYKNWK